ncbi:MAG: HAD family hydrolase [Planctomycetota bacterium]
MIELVAFDMEGCLTAAPTVWEIMHRKWGTWESHGAPYWDQYRAGELHYDEFAMMDVACWKGAPVEMLQKSVREVPLMTGCKKLLASLGHSGIRTVIITNGLMELARRLVDNLNVSHAAGNRVKTHRGKLTGELELHVPFDAKGRILEDLCERYGVSPEEAAAVGDGRADADMFVRSGVSVAFCPGAPEVQEAATHVVREPDLRNLIPILRGEDDEI